MEKKVEVLSPVGSKSAFYTAIKAGADAVYMGLSKFNARMRADNISLEDLRELVEYAHLKGVCVYITLNTLVSDGEMSDVVDMVGKCLDACVDAFIVQDYGIIGLLKRVYPNIVLHGSTQLGVHNRYGAEVAKSMGLSRVVLSRETAIEDIKDIADNVDIELEVFVQGAMCVAFSGNCYISSIKHNASGNRGECKQLCRLPYTLTNKKTSHTGYEISPRDNCMIDYVSTLCDIGVVSFKIEGRLRHEGYVAITTNIYRDCVDSYLASKNFDCDSAKQILKRVFARGEYTPGYLNGNNIIDANNNKHVGVFIGNVLGCDRFKDIYKYTLDLSRDIVAGDGLRIIGDGVDVSLGVGNIDKSDNKYMVYGKKYLKPKSKVYLTLDSRLEGGYVDKSRKREICISINAKCGERISCVIECNNLTVRVAGAVCEKAKSMPLSKDNITKSFSKIDNNIFVIKNLEVTMDDNIFLPISEINALRRKAIDVMTSKLLTSEYISEVKKESGNTFENSKDVVLVGNEGIGCKYSNIAIVDENMNINKLCDKYDSLIFSPTNYDIGTIQKFLDEYVKYFESVPYINLPIIAMKEDLVVIDKIIDVVGNRAGYIANNIYALSYVDRVDLMAGWGLNISNNYAMATLRDMGVKECVSSIEKWCPTIPNTYKVNNSKLTLMTFAHCPNKTLLNCDCSKCGHTGNLDICGSGGKFTIRRYKVAKCYFEMVDTIESCGKNSENQIVDLR